MNAIASGTLAFGGTGALTINPAAAGASMTIGSAKTVAFNASAVTTLSDGFALNANLTVTGSGNTGLTGTVPTGAAGALGAITGGNDLTVAMAPAGMVSVTGSGNWANTTVNSGTLLVNTANPGTGTTSLNGGVLRIGAAISKDITVGSRGGAIETASALSYTGNLTATAGSENLVLRNVGAALTIITGTNTGLNTGITLATAGTPASIFFTGTAAQLPNSAYNISIPDGLSFGGTAVSDSNYTNKVRFVPTGIHAIYDVSSNNPTPDLSGLDRDVWIGLSGTTISAYTLRTSGSFQNDYRIVPIATTTITGSPFTGIGKNLIVSAGVVPTDANSSPTNLFGSGIALTISAAQNYTGTTTVQGGVKNALMGGGVSAPTLTVSGGGLTGTSGITVDKRAILTFMTAGSSGQAVGAAITVKGGGTMNVNLASALDADSTLTLGGNSGGGTYAATGTQTLASLTIAAGANTISGAGILNITGGGGAGYTRSVGGFLNDTQLTTYGVAPTAAGGSSVATGAGPGDEILIGAANAGNFIAAAATFGNPTYTAGNDLSTWTSAKNYQVTGAVSSTVGNGNTINSLNFTNAQTVTFGAAANVLNLASGMILGNNVNVSIGNAVGNGEIRTANGQDLIFNQVTGGTMTVNAKIGQQGGTTTQALTKAGAGTLTLTNTNNQIGDIYVNGGTVTGSGGLNRLGDVDNTARTWYLFGGGIKTDSIASSANRTSIVVGPQGGYIVQTQGSPSGTLQIGTTTGPNATAITLNGTLYIGGNELGGDPSLYSTQLKGNISGPGIIFASGHSNWGRKHVVTLSGVNTAWSGGIYSGGTLPFSNINNSYSGNAVIRVDNTDALGTGPIVMDSGANGYNSMGMTFTANAGSSYANDFRLNMAMYFQNWKTNGSLTLSGRIVGSTGLLLQGYDAGGGSVSETVLAGTVSMNGTPNANGGAAGSVGAGQYYNYGTASVIQNFVNGQGGVNVGATALIGATTLVAGHINSMLSYNSLTTVESVGAEGYVRFSGTNSFIPGAVGPGYLAALRKGGSTVLNYGYLLTAGSTYTPPQGKSFVIGTLGTGTAQVGTLGGAGSGTANFDGGTKHDVNTGQLLAGLYGGDVNIHGNASGDTASLNLLAKDADTVLVLGTSNPVVFTPTWGDSGGQSCLTQMRTRTGGTTLSKTGAGTLTITDADYRNTDGTSARSGFTWNVTGGTLRYEKNDGAGANFAGVNIGNGCNLSGSGTINGAVAVTSGTISPGNAGPGKLTVGSIAFNSSAATFAVELNGGSAGSGYDQLVVASGGTVTLANVTMSGSLGYSPVAGTTFTIIDNQGSNAVSGTFNGLAQGSLVSIGGNPFPQWH